MLAQLSESPDGRLVDAQFPSVTLLFSTAQATM
jgi:hypothetical protein